VINDVAVDMTGRIDALHDIEVRIEPPTVRISQTLFALFVKAEQSPVLLGDRMVDVAKDFGSAVEDVDERLERLEGIQCQLGNRIFWLFLVRFGRCDTTI
jgi:hypothetical protein